MAKAAKTETTTDAQYIVQSNLSHDNTDYVAGDPIEMDEKQAEPLLALGVIATKGA